LVQAIPYRGTSSRGTSSRGTSSRRGWERAVERLLRPELPNVLVEIRDGPFPSNIVPEFLKFLSIDCPTIVCVHELEYLTPLLIGKLLCTSTFSILFVKGYKLLVGDGTTIVLVDAIKKVFCFCMVQRA
jgi:hypothetical protein